VRRALDGLLLLALFTVSFAKLRRGIGGLDVNVADLTAGLFLLAFLWSRVRSGDWRAPRTAAILAAFFAGFLIVYAVGYFNLDSTESRNLFLKGLVVFVVHFAFVVAAVAHLARRTRRFYWRSLAWFVAGIAVNAAYGLLELLYTEATGKQLDSLVLAPLTGETRGIQLFGVTHGANVYRTNGLTLDPNHLGILLVVPLLIVLPLYVRLERGHRLRVPLALLLVFLAIVELSTLSRSALLGVGVGIVVLLLPYGRHLLSARVLVPLGLLGLIVLAVVAQRTGFYSTIFHVRTSLGSHSTQTHFDLYLLVSPVLASHPLFGLGLNTFSSYYEFVTGKSNWGPHSYYISVLTETGLVGGVVFLAYLAYMLDRLGALRGAGAALLARGDRLGLRVRPLAWGLTAALAGTLAANAFYLTMQMPYFVAFALLVFAAPLVFART